MKILVFGSGALGSLMIHYLCKAGNEVTVVARSTAADLQRNGLVIRHYLQRETTIDFPKIVETAPEDQNFDIVFFYIDKKFDEWRLQHQGLPMPTWDKIKVYLSDNH